jgi:YidC/Oxa1 family membrane protein insertase
VVPLLQALKWINRFVGNYGWSIILLTVFINLVIFPLRHRSMVSMRKMQALQPEMKAIQERYAKYKVTDPERQKMNQEMMALYRQRGVNPASGCVPMLLTMPVLFAFYSMLYAAIEMRGAPFVGWITDLSRHDPLYVTPVLMGLSMLWQQRITPTTADPVQQRIFMLMPVFFLVFFLWAPAGLVIYWFVSNLLAIGQQYITNRLIGPPAVAVRPAVARPAKAANSAGKS